MKRFLLITLLLCVFNISISSAEINKNKNEAHAYLKNMIKKDLTLFIAEEKIKNFVTPTTKKSYAQKRLTILIDPGHGGRDTGAINYKGGTEKDVVLSICKRLMLQLNKNPRLKVILSRQGDYFLPLRTRLTLARKYNADLFISIHADANFDKNASGASVYALSQHGATSEAARWLARRENAELGEINLNGLKDRSPVVRSILIDLAQTATIRASLKLGNSVLDQLETVTKLHYSHVEQAPFIVLKSPDIPSILIEVGFISHFNEGNHLLDPVYQEKLARAIAKGLANYVQRL